MAQDLPRVVSFPGFAGSLGGELLVEADEQVDQLAAHRPGAQQVGFPGVVMRLCRALLYALIVGSVDDPVHAVMSLAGLVQQAADLLQGVRHVIPPRGDDGAATRPPGHAI